MPLLRTRQRFPSVSRIKSRCLHAAYEAGSRSLPAIQPLLLSVSSPPGSWFLSILLTSCFLCTSLVLRALARLLVWPKAPHHAASTSLAQRSLL